MKKETLNVIDEITKIRQNRTQLHGATEQNFNKIAEFWSVYKGVNFTADDVGIMMALLKFARIINGDGTNIDNYIDGANYIALAGELKYNKQNDVVVEKTDANIVNDLKNLEIKQTKPEIITLEVLKEKNVCEDLIEYFKSLNIQEIEVMELVERIHNDKQNYSRWFFEELKLSGLCKRFYENGRIEYRINYKDGKLDGLCSEFYSKGNIYCRSNYSNGKCISYEKFTVNGKKMYII